MTSLALPSRARAVPLIVAAGCLIAILSFGPRSTMGFFLTPMTAANGLSREVFALAIAIQNLVWGFAQPLTGMIADKFGTARVIVAGAVVYVLGLVLMSMTSNAVTLQFTAGVLIGLGIAGTSFTLVLAAFARLLPAEMRTLAFGIGTAAGSVGQFIFAPLGQAFIQAYGWHTALLIIAAMIVVVPFLAIAVRGRPGAKETQGASSQSLREAVAEAFGNRSYRLLFSGFFVCGFQIVFITVHLPPYLHDLGISAKVGGYAIGLIGLFNIIGAITAGVLSGRLPKRWILAWLYLMRSVVITIFVLTPPSEASVLVFSAAMGLMWLSTVPPTQQIVAVMFGTRYMATLFGFVFLSHQVGSFLGAWLGGFIYDRTGSYELVWWICVALGIFAAAVHVPIDERPVARPAAAT